MPSKKIATPQEIYQLKVTLLGTRPPIWRRLLVPADSTLEDLHHVLQAAMGWLDCHMHDFQIGQKMFGKPDPDESFMGQPTTASESTARLFRVLGKAGAKAVYSYDFGDGWEHRITVEKVLAPEPGRAYPACIDGKRRCPPEDCGGVYGFYSLLESIGDPEHEQYAEMIDWLGENFDPEAFSIDEVNGRLGYLRRRRSEAEGA
jgi:hypothetical protein